MSHPQLICFACGQAVPSADGLRGPQAQAIEVRLNRTQDGEVCDACAERLLEALPSLLASVRAGFQHNRVADESDDAPRGEPLDFEDEDRPRAG